MKTIEVKFNIGDEVTTKETVQKWAIGHYGAVQSRKVYSIAVGAEDHCVYAITGGGQYLADNLIPYSEVKSYAIQWLTERLSVVAREGV